MIRAKGNVRVLSSVFAGVVLIVAAGWYLYSKWEINQRRLDELKQNYAELKVLDEKNANAAASRMDAEPKETHGKAIDTVNIRFRAIGLNHISPGADQEIAFEVLNEIKNSDYFDASRTTPTGDLSPEVPLNEQGKYTSSSESPGTFSFRIAAKLKRPLTL